MELKSLTSSKHLHRKQKHISIIQLKAHEGNKLEGRKAMTHSKCELGIVERA